MTPDPASVKDETRPRGVLFRRPRAVGLLTSLAAGMFEEVGIDLAGR